MAVSLDDLSFVGPLGGDEGETGEGCPQCQEQLRLAGELGKALLADNQLLQQDAQELKDVIEGLKEEREQLSRQHLEQLNAVHTTCTQENQQLQEQAAELTDQLRASQRWREEQRRGEEESTGELRARIAHLESKIENLESVRQLTPPPANDWTLGDGQSRVSQKELEELQSELSALQDGKEAGRARLARLERDLRESRRRERALGAELERSSEQLEGREREVEGLWRDLEELQQTLCDLHQEAEATTGHRSTGPQRQTVDCGSPGLESTGESLHEELMRLYSSGNQGQLVGDAFSLAGPAPLTSFQNCQNCEDLQEEVRRLKRECEGMAKQMMMLVRQKFDMAQQIDQWQSDMEVMVKDSIVRQLRGEERDETTPPLTPPPATSKSWTGRFLSIFS